MGGGNGPRKDERPLGRDELNLAEFPITLLTDRPLTGVKTLAFEDRHGKLTVSGSDAYGLPTAPDADVIVALIQLTKLRNNFTDPTVPFTRYEALRLLGWPDRGHYYRRLDESLNRWIGVTLYYEKAWWDNEVKCRVDAKFHILESVVLFDREIRRTLRARHQPLPSSSFTWNKVFLKSCRDGNLKQLDLDTYFSLKSAVSKQTFRFLGKRFHVRGDWTFDLEEFAFEHVGLSRNYAPRKVKQKLRPALEELEGIGFLEPMTAAGRYIKVGRGNWNIRVVRKLPTLAAPKPEPEPEPAGLVKALVDRGVNRSIAAELAKGHAADLIAAKIAEFDWLRERHPRKVRDAGAYLAASIRANFAPPAGFQAEAERVDRARSEAERRRHEAEAKAREREDDARVESYWSGLPRAEQARIEAAVLGDAASRAEYDGLPRRLKGAYQKRLRAEYLRTLLGLPAAE
jgi:hypothetical protein